MRFLDILPYVNMRFLQGSMGVEEQLVPRNVYLAP